MVVKNTKETMDLILKLLKDETPFTFSRTTDGQLLYIIGKFDPELEHHYTPKLKELQIKAMQINDPNYLLGMVCAIPDESGMVGNVLGKFKNDEQLQEIVKENIPDWQTRTFYQSSAIQASLLFDQPALIEMFRLINKRKRIVIVGGREGADKVAKEYFPNSVWINTPITNAFAEIESIMNEIYQARPDIVLTSCALASQVIQYFMFIDNSNITTINFGSMFDALMGLKTRGWINDSFPKIEEFKKLWNTNTPTQ